MPLAKYHGLINSSGTPPRHSRARVAIPLHTWSRPFLHLLLPNLLSDHGLLGAKDVRAPLSQELEVGANLYTLCKHFFFGLLVGDLSLLLLNPPRVQETYSGGRQRVSLRRYRRFLHSSTPPRPAPTPSPTSQQPQQLGPPPLSRNNIAFMLFRLH